MNVFQRIRISTHFQSILIFWTRKLCSPIILVFFLVLFLFYLSGNQFKIEYRRLNSISPPPATEGTGSIPTQSSPSVSASASINSSTELMGSLAKYFVNYVNQLGQMKNSDKFGALKHTDIVLTIQVHNRIQYLRELIDSLAVNRGIGENIVLIFSHDYIDEEINRLIQSIDFCRTLQIFYPFSLQLYPHEFPGPDPNDCPAFIKKKEALRIKCNNAHSPDKYGHYREAHLSAIKHHTFWKFNFVLDVLPLTKSHPGYFLFLEEDHYVAPDLIHVIQKMAELKERECPECDLMNLKLAVDSMTANYAGLGANVQVSEWDGWLMVFNRTLWRKLYDCAEAFCSYDDYHWDWSIRYVTTSCLKKRLISMSDKTPRVFHIGQCGTHRFGNCSSSESVDKVKQLFQESTEHLYPETLKLNCVKILTRIPVVKIPTPFGGWGDPRDQQFCIRISNLTNWS